MKGHFMTTRTLVQARARGLTLIELVVALAIVGILSTLAMPRYTGYMQRAHRAHAKAAVLKVAQFMERAATASGVYPQSSTVPTTLLAVEGGRYTVTLTVPTSGVSFTVTAQRATGTPQASDDCGDFVLQHTGATSIVNGASTATAADCWAR
jgi:type IV pilus assembly protein PilE